MLGHRSIVQSWIRGSTSFLFDFNLYSDLGEYVYFFTNIYFIELLLLFIDLVTFRFSFAFIYFVKWGVGFVYRDVVFFEHLLLEGCLPSSVYSNSASKLFKIMDFSSWFTVRNRYFKTFKAEWDSCCRLSTGLLWVVHYREFFKTISK